MAVACLENRQKLTPASVTVAPKGAAAPADGEVVAGRTTPASSDSSMLFPWLPRSFRAAPGLLHPGPSHLEERLRIHSPEQRHERRHKPGPSGLVAGAQTGAVVTVEVLVEEQVITPVR